MKEQVQFYMPEDPEMCIAALAVVQDYEALLKKLIKDKQYITDYEIWIDKVPEELEELVPLNMLLGRYTAAESTFEFTFDKKRARTVGISTNKHVVECFGILLGVETLSIFPRTFTEQESNNTILVLKDSELVILDDLLDLLTINFPSQRIEVIENTLSEENLEKVKQALSVIGKRSVLTYLACGYNKKVVEWTTDTYSGWLTKLEHPDYRILTLTKGRNLTSTIILRIMMNWGTTEKVYAPK